MVVVVVVVVEELFLFNDTIGDPGRLRLSQCSSLKPDDDGQRRIRPDEESKKIYVLQSVTSCGQCVQARQTRTKMR